MPILSDCSFRCTFQSEGVSEQVEEGGGAAEDAVSDASAGAAREAESLVTRSSSYVPPLASVPSDRAAQRSRRFGTCCGFRSPQGNPTPRAPQKPC